MVEINEVIYTHQYDSINNRIVFEYQGCRVEIEIERVTSQKNGLADFNALMEALAYLNIAFTGKMPGRARSLTFNKSRTDSTEYCYLTNSHRVKIEGESAAELIRSYNEDRFTKALKRAYQQYLGDLKTLKYTSPSERALLRYGFKLTIARTHHEQGWRYGLGDIEGKVKQGLTPFNECIQVEALLLSGELDHFNLMQQGVYYFDQIVDDGNQAAFQALLDILSQVQADPDYYSAPHRLECFQQYNNVDFNQLCQYLLAENDDFLANPFNLSFINDCYTFGVELFKTPNHPVLKRIDSICAVGRAIENLNEYYISGFTEHFLEEYCAFITTHPQLKRMLKPVMELAIDGPYDAYFDLLVKIVLGKEAIDTIDPSMGPTIDTLSAFLEADDLTGLSDDFKSRWSQLMQTYLNTKNSPVKSKGLNANQLTL